MFSYISIALKLLLGLIAIVIQINLMGKGNLAPTNAVDQLQNYVLGGIIGGMLYNQDITLVQFFMILLIWTFIVMLFKFMTNHNYFVKRIVDGTAITIIYNGKLQTDEINRSGITARDLAFKLRQAGVADIRHVKRAVLEQNGQLTVTQVGDDPVKYPLIMDGQVDLDALEMINRDEAWLMRQLKLQNIPLNQVYLANYTAQKLIIFPYSGDTHETADDSAD